MIRASWPMRPLGRCAKFLSGGTPDKARPEYWDGDIPWVSSGEMTERHIFDTPLHINEEGARQGSRLIPENTVLAVVRGMSLAKEFRVAITRREVAFNQDLKAFVCEPDVDAEFLFYALLARREHIRELATEASHGTKRLETDVLSAVQIHVPKSDIQRHVVSVLSAYDDLIENNRRRMALLEEVARQLYREWFVRFRFPGHEHIHITNGVPRGWEKKLISDLTVYLKRGIAPNYDEDAEGLVINQKCVRNGRLDLTLARHQSREFKPDRQVQQGDVLVNSTGEGTLGRVAQILVPIPNCTIDTHVTIVRPEPRAGIHYFGLAVSEWEPRFSAMGRGATNQTELSPGQIGAAEILLPSTPLRQQFEEFAAPVFRQVATLTDQNDDLRFARDLLLPRLMSGEITV
jgi:type I restriction enzyme, S subunit